MSAELTQGSQLTPENVAEQDFPYPPTDLPYDDGEPLESNRHRIAMNVLIDGAYAALAERDDFFAGGNMFLYYNVDQARNRDFRGPDFFVTLGVDGRKERKYWAIWDEQGRYPDVIVELMSASTRQVDLTAKKQLYAETFRTGEYYVYDPFDADSLQGWQIDAAQRYQALAPNEQGWLWCETLGLWLGAWPGTILRESAPWLRFYTADGSLVLLPSEQAKLAEQQRDAEQQARERAEQREQQARQRAELAEQQRNAAEQARLESVARLLAMGLGVAEVAAALDLPVVAVEQVRDAAE